MSMNKAEVKKLVESTIERLEKDVAWAERVKNGNSLIAKAWVITQGDDSFFNIIERNLEDDTFKYNFAGGCTDTLQFEEEHAIEVAERLQKTADEGDGPKMNIRAVHINDVAEGILERLPPRIESYKKDMAHLLDGDD